MANVVSFEPDYYPNPDRSRALAGGKIFVGIVDLDPTVLANQKQISVIRECGDILEVSQPIFINDGGVPVYNGTPVTIIVDGSYSMAVLDKHGAQTYYMPKNSETTGVTLTINTIAILRTTPGDFQAQVANVSGHDNPIDGGGGPTFIWDEGQVIGFYVDNDSSVIVPGDGSAAWLSRFENLQVEFYEDIRKFKGFYTGQKASIQGRDTLNDGGEGSLTWNASDLSAEVASDPFSGIFIADNSDLTGASGAWVRDWDKLKAILEWFGCKAAPSNSTDRINAALNILSRELTVASGLDQDYFATGRITIDGNTKILDLKGNAVTFEFVDDVGVHITSSSGETNGSGLHNARLFFNGCTGDNNEGIRVDGKARYVNNQNILVSAVGLSPSIGGIGYHIVGGTAGNTPFFGYHVNVKTQGCWNGIEITGLDGDLSADVTTQTFINCYSPSSRRVGLTLRHASTNTFINTSIESSGTDGVVQDDCSRNQFFGGILEGSGGANWVEENRRAATNMPLMQTDFGTLTIGQYEDLPDLWFGNTLFLKRTGMPIVSVANTGIIQFPNARGVLTVQTRRGGFARFNLSTTTDTVTKQVTILESFVSGDTWTTTKGLVGLNVYWNAGDSKWELENLSTVTQVFSTSIKAE